MRFKLYVIRGEVSAGNGCFDMYVAVRDLTLSLPLGLSIYEFPTWANEKFKKTKKVRNHHPFSVRRAQYDIVKS